MPYWGVRRQALALLLTCGVPAGMLHAPFLHAHPDENHHAAAVHAHVGGHAHPHDDAAERGQTGLQEPEEARAIYLDALVAVDSTTAAVAAVSVRTVELATPPELPAHRSVEITHGHDPPLAAALESRPPPTRLS